MVIINDYRTILREFIWRLEADNKLLKRDNEKDALLIDAKDMLEDLEEAVAVIRAENELGYKEQDKGH